jgi:DNA polymerase
VDQSTLNRVLTQHAETSRLLGVNFVPVYRRAAEPGSAEPALASAGDLSPPEAEASEIEAPEVVVTAASRTAPPAPQSPAPQASVPAAAPARPAGPRDPAQAQRLLDDLRARYERDAPHQHFVTAHHNIVFGEGDPCARLMFIGEAPGAEEDRTGRPFVGRAGQLLEKMITAMGLSRSQVYIANVLKTRPPDNATPTSEEIRLCAPYLYEQIGIICPEAIVTLGLPASRALLETMDSMSRLRGRWASFRLPLPLEGSVPVMPTYHPAFLLRSYTAENRAKVWSDLQQVMVRLGLAAPAPTAAAAPA